MKVVIMAGGKGTRISSIVSDRPKPMIPIENVPILEYEIERLRDQGFTDIIITVSYLADVIMNYFGDGNKISPATGKPFNVHIEYYVESKPLGNAGALLKMKNELNEDFLLINADVIYDIDFKRFVDFHKRKGAIATLFTHPNSHPYDSGLIVSDSNGCVRQWLTKEDNRPQWYKNQVNAGIQVINPKAIELVKTKPEIVGTEVDGVLQKVDLDRDVLKPLAGTGLMFSYESPEYVKDMGTPERFEQVKRDLISGVVAKKSLKQKQRAIFLDRDGTINKYVGFCRDINDFELIPGIAKAIKMIKTLAEKNLKWKYQTSNWNNGILSIINKLSDEDLKELYNILLSLPVDLSSNMENVINNLLNDINLTANIKRLKR